MPVYENLILIAYAIIPKEISIILPLMTKIFSGYIKLGLIFGLSLHLNPYALCAINIGSVDESVLFGNYLVSSAHVMVLSYKFLPGRIS